MKTDIIDFLESKGYFSLYGLIIIIIGEVSDLLEYNTKWSFIKFFKFIGYYYLFFFCWLVLDLIVNHFRKRNNH